MQAQRLRRTATPSKWRHALSTCESHPNQTTPAPQSSNQPLTTHRLRLPAHAMSPRTRLCVYAGPTLLALIWARPAIFPNHPQGQCSCWWAAHMQMCFGPTNRKGATMRQARDQDGPERKTDTCCTTTVVRIACRRAESTVPLHRTAKGQVHGPQHAEDGRLKRPRPCPTTKGPFDPTGEYDDSTNAIGPNSTFW